MISSEVPYPDLFREPKEQESNNNSSLIPDEHRNLMDDLGIKADAEGAQASIFTGEEELFAFHRTMSRLAEMQTKEYWEAWEKHR